MCRVTTVAISSNEDSTAVGYSCETCIKTEVKQEPSWLEKTSTESKIQIEEVGHISHLSFQNDIKKFAQIKSKSKEVAYSTFQNASQWVNGASGDFPPESPRNTEAALRNDTSRSTLLTHGNLEKIKLLKYKRREIRV